jgi:hypothetical protein
MKSKVIEKGWLEDDMQLLLGIINDLLKEQ